MGRFINADAFASTGTGLLGNNMFSYCNGNPIRFSDPTGHAIWGTNTVAICDGGSGLSTTEYEYAQEIVEQCYNKVSLDMFGVSSNNSTRITKRDLTVDVSEFELFLAGAAFDAADATISTITKKDITGVSGFLFGVSKAFLPTPEDIIYCGIPKLPNGKYTVYEIDATISKTPYYNPVSCTTVFIESHVVTTFYSLDNPTNEMFFGSFLDARLLSAI